MTDTINRAPTRPQDLGEIQLYVNNIEVVYHDIVQVLRGRLYRCAKR